MSKAAAFHSPREETFSPSFPRASFADSEHVQAGRLLRRFCWQQPIAVYEPGAEIQAFPA